jgi:hypothetical protein
LYLSDKYEDEIKKRVAMVKEGKAEGHSADDVLMMLRSSIKNEKRWHLQKNIHSFN